MVQSPGSALRLPCSVSPPSAAVSWRFRGRLLDRDAPPGVELAQDALAISNLTSSHAGVYQCVARFGHGPAVASRLARVALAGTDADNDLRCALVFTSKSRRGKKEEASLGRGSHVVSVDPSEGTPAAEWRGGRKQ